MSNERDEKLGRRGWISRSLVVLAAAPVLGACGSGEDALECDQTAGLSAQQMQSRTGLHYADVAASPSRACHLCTLYTGNATTCGACTVVPGPIHPHASCDAFVARS